LSGKRILGRSPFSSFYLANRHRYRQCGNCPIHFVPPPAPASAEQASLPTKGRTPGSVTEIAPEAWLNRRAGHRPLALPCTRQAGPDADNCESAPRKQPEGLTQEAGSSFGGRIVNSSAAKWTN
jgi:hypothetical protein